jgi:Flp pilus assembly protein TadG
MKQLITNINSFSVRIKQRCEDGQSMVLGALSMVVLIGFVGLAIDIALIMDAQRELGLVADGSALAAASALTEEYTLEVNQDNARARAAEYARLNGFEPTATGNTIDVSFPTSTPPRRQVAVKMTSKAKLAFMPVFGESFKEVTITSSSGNNQGVGEASPLDIVIVQDVSGSQREISHCSDPGLSWVAINPAYYHDEISPCLVNLKAWVPEYTTGLLEDATYDPGKPTNYDFDYWTGAIEDHFNPVWQPFNVEQDAARKFVNDIGGISPGHTLNIYDHIGLVSFSDNNEDPYIYQPNARVLQPLTSNFNDVLNAIGYSPMTPGETGIRGMVPAGYTDMAAGIRQGINVLSGTGSRSDAVAIMILISDGSPTNDNSGNKIPGCDYTRPGNCDAARQAVQRAAQEAQDRGITIFTVFVGGSETQDDSALLLQWIADLTDNRRLDGNYSGTRALPHGYGPPLDPKPSPNYFLAERPEDLNGVYTNILKTIYTRIGYRDKTP